MLQKNYIYILLFIVFISISAYYLNYSERINLDLVPKTFSLQYETKLEYSLCINQTSKSSYDYLNKYPFISDCNTDLNFKNVNMKNYSEEAPIESHEYRINRGIIVYLPFDKHREFMIELKWLYASWIEMQLHEPALWRTDLIVFTEKPLNFLNELNCSALNVRKNKSDKPMCTIIYYLPINQRNYSSSSPKTFDFFLKEFNIFNNSDETNSFYELLNSNLKKYSYVDSILMAFDGYSYFKQADFDYLIRSDMDVFLTPLFSKWLPKRCNDFYVGRGGYSNSFNDKRLRRIASNLHLQYAGARNLGSTWYSTPHQFRLVSYLTLVLMSYLSTEEFSQPEREGKLGTLLWPEWHYGVLLLYGQNIALNHLIASKQLNVVKLEDQIDYPSGNSQSIYKMLHIHVFHGDNLFSKFQFKAGKYDNLTVSKQNSTIVKYYALKMALQAKNTQNIDLYKLFLNSTSSKT